MDRFGRLHTYLETVLANPPASQDSQAVSKLQVKLERARPAFLEFLDTPAKSSQQRQQLEKGQSGPRTLARLQASSESSG